MIFPVLTRVKSEYQLVRVMMQIFDVTLSTIMTCFQYLGWRWDEAGQVD